MMATPLLFGLAASVVTMVGGMVALRWRRHLVLILGLAAGVVLGVALFDLLPDAVELGGATVGTDRLIPALGIGLGGYLLVDQGLHSLPRRTTRWGTHLAPATLTLHSLVDGLGIGFAFQAGDHAGWLVAIAVLTHDFADGVNTVGLCLATPAERAAKGWMVMNGLAPLIGVLIGLQLPVPTAMLALLLAGFAGAFLYIGACELIPRSRTLDPSFRTTAASLAGFILVAVVTSIAR